MRKGLLIAGIILLIAGILCLLFSALCWFAYRNTLDASNDFYHKKYQLALIFLIIGIIIFVLGILCIALRRKVTQ